MVDFAGDERVNRFFRHKEKDTIGEVTPQEVQQRLAEGAPLLLLDVREPQEYAEAHIAGSTLIPLGQLSLRLNELPQDRPIVAVCRSGNRSGVAA
jgi:rhodanese-related sulfurtransferase